MDQGGAAGSTGGSGGAAGSGAGTGGSGGALPSCAGPADATKSSVCVTFAPEAMTFEASDAQLDGKGILYLAAYDTPLPDGQPGTADDAVPLKAAIFPADGTSTVALSEIPALRLDGLPPKVYLRALFFDNAEALAQKQIAWGVWVGGSDLSKGISGQQLPVAAVDLTPGAGQARSMDLVALRQLEVKLERAPGAQPLDDGAGPLQWLAINQAAVAQDLPFFGVGTGGCQKLLPNQPVTVRGFVIGSGDRYIVANLDDYGQKAYEAGTITNLEVVNGGYSVPASSRVTFGPTTYRAALDMTLNSVIPLGPGEQLPAPYKCP